MLIREGAARTGGVDVLLAASLASAAGAVNAAGFQATGLFSANMTGNASSLSDHIGLGDWGIAALFAAMLVAFVGGAFVGSGLIEIGKLRQWRGVYAICIFVEGLLLMLLGGIVGTDSSTSLLLPLGLSALMGLQNAVTTRVSSGQIRTTHVSGMSTDLGIHLARALSGHREALGRVAFFGTTMVAFIGGGVAGVASYVVIGSPVFVLVGALLLGLGSFESWRASHWTHPDP